MSFAGLLVAGTAATADAQCAFDAPTRARTFGSSLVRAFQACPSPDPDDYPLPNTATSAGVPACSPPVTVSPWSFDADKGKCDFRMSQKVLTPCPDGVEPSCSVLQASTRCAGILDADGVTLTNTSGWTQSIRYRLTFNDAASGDLTMITVSPLDATVAVGPTVDGKFKSEFQAYPCRSFTCVESDVFGWFGILPPCTQVEIFDVTLYSPDGEVFATLGSSTR